MLALGVIASFFYEALDMGAVLVRPEVNRT